MSTLDHTRTDMTKLLIDIAKQFRTIDEEGIATMIDYVAAMNQTRTLEIFEIEHHEELQGFLDMARQGKAHMGAVSMRADTKEKLVELFDRKVMQDEVIPEHMKIQALYTFLNDDDLPADWRKHLGNEAKERGWV